MKAVCMDKEEPTGSHLYRNRRWYQAAARAYHYVMTIHGHPREIALGLALGLFVAMTPTLGFQMIIAVFLATVFRWNRFSAAAGVWLSNPLTAPFIYGLAYLVGAWVLGFENNGLPKGVDVHHIDVLLRKAPGIIWALTVGGLILGIPVAILGYYLSFSAIEKYRAALKDKRERKIALDKFKKEQYQHRKSAQDRSPPI